MRVWISSRKWNDMELRVEKCEKLIQIYKEETRELVKSTAKKILEQPEQLLEEIRGIEDIERMVDEFIYH